MKDVAVFSVICHDLLLGLKWWQACIIVPKLMFYKLSSCLVKPKQYETRLLNLACKKNLYKKHFFFGLGFLPQRVTSEWPTSLGHRSRAQRHRRLLVMSQGVSPRSPVGRFGQVSDVSLLGLPKLLALTRLLSL